MDYFILGKFHWNICIFKVFKGVGQICPPPLVQIGSKCTLVQIGLNLAEWQILSKHISYAKIKSFYTLYYTVVAKNSKMTYRIKNQESVFLNKSTNINYQISTEYIHKYRRPPHTFTQTERNGRYCKH